MQVLQILRNIVTECVKVITFGAKIQGDARAKLISGLQEICNNSEDSYAKVRLRLKPVKNAASDPKQLATALRDFAADLDTRLAFKPEHICGKIDVLLQAFESNLDPLKFSVDRTRIASIKQELQLIGNYDESIRQQYDQFTMAMDQLSYELEKNVAPAEIQETVSYIIQNITDFEKELSLTIECVRDAKKAIISGSQK